MGFIGDIFGGGSAKKAAKAQVEATKLGINEMRRQFDQTRSDLAPWRVEGSKAIGQLGAMLQPGYDHTKSPGYEFRLGEGLRAVENSAAARGILQSGGTLKGIERYAEGMAADDFDRAFNRTASVAAGGQQVGTALGQLGADKSRGIAELYTQQGNAKASGYIGQANAIGNTLGQIASIGAMFLSDERLKKNVEEVGLTEDGIPAVAFNYRQDKGMKLPRGRFIGVMAQDVERVRPDAAGPRVNGYRSVDYSRLGDFYLEGR